MRTSRKQIQDTLERLSDENVKYELVVNQMLGNRKDYYYTYSVRKSVPSYTTIDFATGKVKEVSYQTGWKAEGLVLRDMSLNDIMKNIDKLF